MESKQLPDGSMYYTGPRGSMRLERSPGGACLAVCDGVQEAEFARVVTALGDELIARHGRCVFLVDSLDSPRMDTGFREAMTSWFASHRKDGRAVAHLLLKSKFIEMAVNVANLVTGTRVARAYTDVREWEEIARKEFGPGFSRKPLSAYLDPSRARTKPATG